MRRALATVASAALLSGLGGSASVALGAGGSASAAKRSGGSACTIVRNKQARRRCARSRAAFRYVAGRGVARVGKGAGRAGASVGAGMPAAAAAPVAGADQVASHAPLDVAHAPALGSVLAPIIASTLGVEAHDTGTFALRLTRTAVPAGTLTVYFRNRDSSLHNLWLAPSLRAGGQAVLISDDVGEGGAAAKSVTVTPGGWRLFCSISGHGSMTRDLAVG